MKQFSLRLIICGMILILMLTACASAPPATSTSTATPQPPKIEEIAFESGSFHVVGDLRLPEGTGPFPVVVFVHGYGQVDRTMFGAFVPIMERMQRAGYATFAWDKPGTGESTGQIDPNHVFAQRGARAPCSRCLRSSASGASS